MQILQITPEFPPDCGGIGYYVFYLSKELTKRGHTVKVFVREKKPRVYSFEGIPVEVLGVTGYPPFNMRIFRKDLEGVMMGLNRTLVR
jgi:hypothetical protein